MLPLPSDAEIADAAMEVERLHGEWLGEPRYADAQGRLLDLCRRRRLSIARQPLQTATVILAVLLLGLAGQVDAGSLGPIGLGLSRHSAGSSGGGTARLELPYDPSLCRRAPQWEKATHCALWPLLVGSPIPQGWGRNDDGSGGPYALALRETQTVLSGQSGGGSGNHVGLRFALAYGFTLAHTDCGDVARARAALLDFYRSQRSTGWCTYRGRDEVAAPGYGNYWLGNAVATWVFAVRDPDGAQVRAAVEEWIAGYLALVDLARTPDGRIALAGRRSEKPNHLPVTVAFEWLTRGRSTGPGGRDRFYLKAHNGGTPGNFAAAIARWVVLERGWQPRAPSRADLPPLAADGYHVVRGPSGVVTWVDAFRGGGADWIHYSARALSGRRGVDYWSVFGGPARPVGPPPFPPALKGPVAEEWVGGLGGWRRVR